MRSKPSVKEELGHQHTERADGSPSTDGAAHRRAVRLPANPLPLDATSPTANAHPYLMGKNLIHCKRR